MSKFSVIGAGAVGGFFGARLADAGHDVTFVIRNEANLVRERGLIVKSEHGDINIAKPQVVFELMSALNRKVAR